MHLTISNSMGSNPSFSLDIAIIGAGVAGLASALTISKLNQDHRIRVFEASPDLSDIGAGIQLNANATRVLFHLGLEDEFRKVAHEPKSLICRRYDNDRILGEFPNNPLSTWIHGFPHLMVYRPDLQRSRLFTFECSRQFGSTLPEPEISAKNSTRG